MAVISQKEQRRALLILAVLYGVWHLSLEWSKLILPFIQWEAKPPISSSQLGLINALGNGFVLAGTFVYGHLLDTTGGGGVKFAALISVFLTGLYYMGCSVTHSVLGFLLLSPLKLVFHLPQICESSIASLTHDQQERTRRIMRLGVPLGAAMVVGPWLAAKAAEYLDLREVHALAGILLIVTSLPLILFTLPELGVSGGGGGMKRSKSMVQLGGDYNQLIGSGSIRKTLILRFLLDGPYQAYDVLSRQFIITQYMMDATDLAYLFVVVGAATVFANTVAIRWLQAVVRPQRLLQLALIMLAIAYFGIGLSEQFYQMCILMPVQVIGISVANAELSAQMTKPIERQHYGKAIGLGRATQLLAGAVLPIVGGYFVEEFDFGMWCNVAAALTLCCVLVVHFLGDYMNVAALALPTDDRSR